MAERKQRKLRATVTFHDTGESYGPDDELPADRVSQLDEAAKDAGLKQHPAFGDDES